jgi:hypothetical protein
LILGGAWGIYEELLMDPILSLLLEHPLQLISSPSWSSCTSTPLRIPVHCIPIHYSFSFSYSMSNLCVMSKSDVLMKCTIIIIIIIIIIVLGIIPYLRVYKPHLDFSFKNLEIITTHT